MIARLLSYSRSEKSGHWIKSCLLSKSGNFLTEPYWLWQIIMPKSTCDRKYWTETLIDTHCNILTCCTTVFLYTTFIYTSMIKVTSEQYLITKEDHESKVNPYKIYIYLISHWEKCYYEDCSKYEDHIVELVQS